MVRSRTRRQHKFMPPLVQIWVLFLSFFFLQPSACTLLTTARTMWSLRRYVRNRSIVVFHRSSIGLYRSRKHKQYLSGNDETTLELVLAHCLAVLIRVRPEATRLLGRPGRLFVALKCAHLMLGWQNAT
jgi:hypothetical protein